MEWILDMDGQVLIYIQEVVRNAFLTPLFRGITVLGNSGAAWVALSLALLISGKTRKAGIMSLTALLFSFLVNNLMLKNLVGRVRPYEVVEGLVPLIPRPWDYSFPSGHTGSSFASAWVFFRKLPRWAGISLLVLAGLIGLSRLYLGVHYPTDVLFGALSGILCGYAAEIFVEQVFYKRSGK